MKPLPMLASPTSRASGRPGTRFEDLMGGGNWVADCKLDGVRAMAQWNGRWLTLRNRVGAEMGHRYPEVVTALSDVLAGRPAVMLDGEIVARNGKFESTLLRDQQSNERTIKSLVKTVPTMFVAFDVPTADAKPWSSRRYDLDRLAETWPQSEYHAALAITVTSMSPDFLAETREMGMEGVIAKRITSRYEFGVRSQQWLKFKNVFSVTCLVAGYAPGTGRRSHFGAMELALLNKAGEPVSVGRVGTGFTGRDINKLKKALDAGELLTVEIQCTNQTSGGTLRFPVYLGTRTDVRPEDCSLEQLEFLPTC